MPPSDLIEIDEEDLVLAAEDCDKEKFSALHRFSGFEERIIRKLVSHGPVLLRGGRGSGKSALMIEAANRLRVNPALKAFGCYVSLRQLPLLRSSGERYEQLLCSIVSEQIERELELQGKVSNFKKAQNLSELQAEILRLSSKIEARVVLLLDDAAHLAREAPLTEFFDIFRTLSTQIVSCKASIYPGVTKFGTRFDVYNDANVVDLARDESAPDFGEFFVEVIQARFPKLLADGRLSKGIDELQFGRFLGRSVIGNMRAFVYTVNSFPETGTIGLPEIQKCLRRMASEYYWPLLEEVAPKLGKYEPLVECAVSLGTKVFEYSGRANNQSALIHRDIVQRLSKVFEILEYAGFMVRREASRAMKSGGRGALFSLNLCKLFEVTPQQRLTLELLKNWLNVHREPFDFHSSGKQLTGIVMPTILEETEMRILENGIQTLEKSSTYPYGLTLKMIRDLKKAKLLTVGSLADASMEKLLEIKGIGEKKAKRIKDVVGQAIWM